MSSVASGPTSRDMLSISEHSELDPKFERSEYFHRTSGKGGWFCSACATSNNAHLHFLDAIAAMKHEKSQAHKDAVGRLTWEPVRAGGWGEIIEPYDQLRYDLSREVDPLKKRVKRWIKDMARAEGIEIQNEDEDDEDSNGQNWSDWGSGGDVWKSTQKEWGLPVSGPPVDDEDPRAAADFKFVEKVARARGLTRDNRRLHAFYRLPTEEKIHRIQEIVHSISCH